MLQSDTRTRPQTPSLNPLQSEHVQACVQGQRLSRVRGVCVADRAVNTRRHEDVTSRSTSAPRHGPPETAMDGQRPT